MTVNATEVVIWSADVDEQTLDGVLANDTRLMYVKLDRLGLTTMGLSKISAVQYRGYQVFADAKIIEVPDKAIEIARLHLQYHPWMLNVMAGTLSTLELSNADSKKVDALKRFADLCVVHGTRPCAVTVLTSKSEEAVRYEYNDRTVIEQVLAYAEILLHSGFTDLVCSPLEARAIRTESCFDRLMLNTPGIRLPGSSKDDQARVDTPAGAIAAGADRLVIGRDLTTGDFNDNFTRIAANLNG